MEMLFVNLRLIRKYALASTLQSGRRAIRNSRIVSSGQHAVLRQVPGKVSDQYARFREQRDGCVLVEERQHLLGSRRVTPIPHQLARDGKQGKHLDTGSPHAIIRVAGSLVVKRAGGVAVRKDCISRITQ